MHTCIDLQADGTPRASVVSRPPLRELVAAVPPTSVVDAKVAMSAACSFLGTVARGGRCELSLLNDANLARWSVGQLRSGKSRLYLRNQLVPLRALLRVQAGLPGKLHSRHGVGTAEHGTGELQVPYADDEVTTLLQAARDAGPGPYCALVAVVGAGFDALGTKGAHVEVADGGLICLARDGTARAVVARVAALVRPGELAPVGEGDWALARRAAARAGTALNGTRALSTWRLAVLSEPAPLAVALRRHPLGQRGLDCAAAHMSPLPPGERSALLRG